MHFILYILSQQFQLFFSTLPISARKHTKVSKTQHRCQNYSQEKKIKIESVPKDINSVQRKTKMHQQVSPEKNGKQVIRLGSFWFLTLSQ